MNDLIIRPDIAEYMTELKAWLKDSVDVPLEEMAAFFHSRLEGYEAHMLGNWAEAYQRMADYIPKVSQTVLDLGCGTGLELDMILKKYPHLQVTGIDLSEGMLHRLQQKHPSVRTVCADYLRHPFGNEEYDLVISFESLHHFTPKQKEELYAKIYRSLKPGGSFIETDYIACCEEEEALLFRTLSRKRAMEQIPMERFVHFDTPLTLEHEMSILKNSGFSSVEPVCCVNGACTIISKKMSA
ncbi:MAG: class I SAM-dependent methyltransferase [Clostridia bacterium]|nr:class I SAM-dependent methyltransferase [Clostridia bacterium]